MRKDAQRSPVQKARTGAGWPRLSPGVADDHALLEVVVADGAHGMSTHHLVSWLGHHHLAGSRNLHGLEARQDSKAEDKRVAALDAHLHLAQVLSNACVAHDPALLRSLVRFGVRLLLEERGAIVVLPNALGAHSHLGHHLDAVADHGTRILGHAALHQALVVVDEEAAGREVGEVLVQRLVGMYLETPT